MRSELDIFRLLTNIQTRRSTFVSIEDLFQENDLNNIRQMIIESEYIFFIQAAFIGNLELVQAMLNIFPHDVQRTMNAASHYVAFRNARSSIWGNSRAVWYYLLSNFPEDSAEMIHAYEQGLFFHAIGINKSYDDMLDGTVDVEDLNIISPGSRDLHTLENLFRNITIQKRQSFVQFGNFLAIRSAIQDGSFFLFEILYHYASLQQRETIAQMPGANALIRQSLIESTPYSGSREIVQEYYLNHMNNPNHRESSMRALTDLEENCLTNILNYYKPMISSEGGVDRVFQKLISTLQERYTDKPSTVQTGDGRTIDLPLSWRDWQTLSCTLNSETRERALQAYYISLEHTAIRYLSIPNFWMAREARFVLGESDFRYADFEDFKELIVTCWLAAGDAGMPSSDESSISDRIDWFIYMIGDIGRAHNRDENVDDEKGDAPSCRFGVKTRLIQSVRAHPLMANTISKDLLNLEMNQYMRSHFINHIPLEKIKELKFIWDQIINGEAISEEHMKLIVQFDVTPEDQNTFLELIKEKYKLQWNEGATSYIEKNFNLSNITPNHVMKHGSIFNMVLEQLLAENTKLSENSGPQIDSLEGLRAARLKFFTSASASASADESKSENKKMP